MGRVVSEPEHVSRVREKMSRVVCVCVRGVGVISEPKHSHIYAKTSMTQTTDICDPHYPHKNIHDLYTIVIHKTIHGPHKSFRNPHNRHP